MTDHIKDFFHEFSDDSPRGNFHKVIPLHESSDHDWQNWSLLVPGMPRGWFELAQLTAKDRIEFIREHWLAKLPYIPKLSSFVTDFFAGLEDVGIYVTQRTYGDPFEVQQVYCQKGGSGFFRGLPPAKESELNGLKSKFSELMLPADYIAFLEIHNGFSKATDIGILPAKQVFPMYTELQEMLREQGALFDAEGRQVNPRSLIRFYDSFGFPCYQCFWSEWYPAEEMGNVYYSGLTHTISSTRGHAASPENMAFPTFLDWLMFYMESILK